MQEETGYKWRVKDIKINWPTQHYVSAIFRNQRIDVGDLRKRSVYLRYESSSGECGRRKQFQDRLKKTYLPHFLSHNISPLKNVPFEAMWSVNSANCSGGRQGPHTKLNLNF